MPRRHWRLRARRQPLSPSLRFFLETGEYPRAEHGSDWLEVKFFSCHVSDKLLAAWQENGAEIVTEWIREHPGTRCWGWWKFDALQARRCVAGSEHLAPVVGEWWWRRSFGVPAFKQVRDPGDADFVVESEATYLQRLELLGADERAALSGDAFESEVVPFDYEGPLLPWRASAPPLASTNGSAGGHLELRRRNAGADPLLAGGIGAGGSRLEGNSMKEDD